MNNARQAVEKTRRKCGSARLGQRAHRQILPVPVKIFSRS
jgi:hypothetical protein